MQRFGLGKWMVEGSSAWLLTFCFCFGQGQELLQVGFGQFELGEDTSTPAGTALFRFRNPDGVLVAEAGVGAVSPIRKGRIFIQRDDTIDTGIALANPSTGEVRLHLTVRGKTGQVYAEREDIVLKSHAHIARFLGELFSDPSYGFVPKTFTGTLTFEVLEGSGVAAVTLRQSVNGSGEPIFTTLPVADLEDNDTGQDEELVFPQIGAGVGLSTQIMLMNESDKDVEGEIRLFTSDGSQLSLDYERGTYTGRDVSEIPFLIMPDGTLFANLTYSGPEDVRVGYAVVTIERGELPTGSAVFRYVDDKGIPISEAGVGAMTPTKRARVVVGTAMTRTGVAIVNPGDESNQVELALLDTNGGPLRTTTREILPNGHIAVFADDLFPVEEGFIGLMELKSSVPFVPITLKLTINSRLQPIITTLPVADLENPPDDNLLVFPQFAMGNSPVGEFLTELIFIGAGGEVNSGGTMSFWEGPEGLPWDLEELRLPSHFFFGVGASAFGWLGRLDVNWDDVGQSASATIPPEGGTLAVENSHGDVVIMEFPAAALPEATKITMTALDERPPNNSGYSLFPGVSLEPEGLVFLWERPQIKVFLAEELKNPEISALVWRSPDGYTLPLAFQKADGHLMVAEVSHFSMFDAEQLTMSQLYQWAEILKTASADQRKRFQPYIDKYGLDDNLVDLLISLDNVNIYLGMDAWAQELGVSTEFYYDYDAKGLLEQAIFKFAQITSTRIPSGACGHYNRIGLGLLQAQDLLIGDAALATTIEGGLLSLTEQCILIDLTGTWLTDTLTGSESCRYRSGKWEEKDKADPVILRIIQTGSHATITVPGYPEVGSIQVQLLASGDLDQPYYFTGVESGSDSIDCKEFLASDGLDQAFGGPVCSPYYTQEREDEPFETYNCKALSCTETDHYTAQVSKDGKHFSGRESWTYIAKFRAFFPGSQETATITCRGSSDFAATKISDMP